MNLEDFLPTYPGYEIEPLFSIYKEELTDVIQRKKEFLELTLQPTEQRPEKRGELLKHQIFLRRFMSGHTPYNTILLWHAVGTGKTGSSIAIAEGLKHFNNSFLKTLILVRSKTFIRNFKNEIAYVMTDGDYLPSNIDKLTEGEKTRRVNKLISDYYEFNTFQVFAKQYISSTETEKKRFVEKYSNRLIIIDEVHNIRKTKSGTYNSIHEFLHNVKDSKIVLLTATPIKDQASEFAGVMNLILPIENQLPSGLEFMNEYFTKIGLSIEDLKSTTIDPAKTTDLINKLKGRISYLQPVQSDVIVRDAGVQSDDAPFPQVELKMDDIQSSIFTPNFDAELKDIKRYEEEEVDEVDEEVDENLDGSDKASSLYNKSIQSALCVSGDKNFSIDKLLAVLNKKKELVDKLELLKKYSCKYYYVIKHIIDNPTHNSFIYCTDVSGPGIEALAELFVVFGFSKASPKQTGVPSKRFASITGVTQEGYTEQILQEFNSPENANGSMIQVIIGSAAIGEGRSLLSVRDIFILTPHWNLTDMDQAIGRGIRFGSHRYLRPEDKTVTIHRLKAVTADEKSIDSYITSIAYSKDILSKKIEAVARTAAIDCLFNKKRNSKSMGIDDTRNCLYQECEYTCAVPQDDEYKEIEDTYNLFYTEKEYQDVKRQLKEIFCKKFEYPIRDVVSLPGLLSYSKIVVLRSITSIIERKEIFINPLGFPNYLKEWKDHLFLCHDASATPDLSYKYDTKIGQTYPEISFQEFISNYQAQNIDSILEHISNNISSRKIAEKLFESFPQELKLELLRFCVTKRKENEVSNFIKLKMIKFYRNEELDGGEFIIIEDLKEKYSVSKEEWSPYIKGSSVIEDFAERLKKSGLKVHGISDKSFKLINSEGGERKGTSASSISEAALKKILADTFIYYITRIKDENKQAETQKYNRVIGETKKEIIIEYIKQLLSNLGLILSKSDNDEFIRRISLND